LHFLILLTILVPTVSPRVLKTFYSSEETGGGYTRFFLVKETIEVIRRYPFFGVGLGNGVRALLDYYFFEGAPHFFSGVHNAFLGIALEVGLIGLLIFLLFLYFSLRLIVKASFKQKRSLKPLCLGAILGIFGLLSPYFSRICILT